MLLIVQFRFCSMTQIFQTFFQIRAPRLGLFNCCNWYAARIPSANNKLSQAHPRSMIDRIRSRPMSRRSSIRSSSPFWKSVQIFLQAFLCWISEIEEANSSTFHHIKVFNDALECSISSSSTFAASSFAPNLVRHGKFGLKRNQTQEWPALLDERMKADKQVIRNSNTRWRISG